MRFFWVADAFAQNKFNIKYHPGKENLGASTRVSTTLVHTTQQSILGTSTNPLVSVSSHLPVSLALQKGVLELCQMVTFIRTHYHKFPLSRVSQQAGYAYGMVHAWLDQKPVKSNKITSFI